MLGKGSSAKADAVSFSSVSRNPSRSNNRERIPFGRKAEPKTTRKPKARTGVAKTPPTRFVAGAIKLNERKELMKMGSKKTVAEREMQTLSTNCRKARE